MTNGEEEKFFGHALSHINTTSLDDYNKEFLQNVAKRIRAKKPLSDKQKARLKQLWEQQQNAKAH